MKLKNIIIILVIWGLVGLAGFALWYQNTLNSSINDRDSGESRLVTNSSSTGDVVSSGEFVFLDRFHQGEGTVEVRRDGDDVFVEFGDDFSVSNGPDLYVWLVNEQELGGSIGGVNGDPGSFIELGLLESNSGAQTYQITASEFEEFNHAVVIWCRAFGVQFSNAVLK